MGRPPYAVAFLYPDNSVDVLRSEDEDNATPGFVSRMEFTIPFSEEVPGADSVLVSDQRVVRDEIPWPEVVLLGTKKIRGRIGILPNGRVGSRGECRSCHEPVVFVRMPGGKTPPFSYEGISHFEQCPDADTWRNRADVWRTAKTNAPEGDETTGA